jgi:hypothetical protein
MNTVVADEDFEINMFDKQSLRLTVHTYSNRVWKKTVRIVSRNIVQECMNNKHNVDDNRTMTESLRRCSFDDYDRKRSDPYENVLQMERNSEDSSWLSSSSMEWPVRRRWERSEHVNISLQKRDKKSYTGERRTFVVGRGRWHGLFRSISPFIIQLKSSEESVMEREKKNEIVILLDAEYQQEHTDEGENKK